MDGDPAPDRLAHHQPLEVVHRVHGLAVDVEDDVLGPDAGLGGRTSLHDLDNLQPALPTHLAGDPGREGPGATGQAQVGPAEPPLGHQGCDDPPGGGVDRHRQAQPLPDARPHDGRVDADDATGGVGQSSP